MTPALFEGADLNTLLVAVVTIALAIVLLRMIFVYRRLRAAEERKRLASESSERPLNRDSGEPLFFRRYVPPEREHTTPRD